MKKSLLILSLFATANLFGQAVPNGTFEMWNSTPYGEPSGWFTSNPQSLSMVDSVNVKQVIGFSGQAVQLHTIIKGPDTDFAYISNTPGDPIKGQGGVPYAQKSTGITGYYRYNLPGNDTALLVILFKKSGSIIGMYIDKIRGTGSQPTFTSFTFNFVPALSTTPDTMIIASASSNAITNKGVQNGSWIELDQLAFTGPSSPIPGGSFDTWTSSSFDVPVGWNVSPNGNGGTGISKTTAKYAGTYAVSLMTLPGGGGPNIAAISTGKFGQSGTTGGYPYTLTKDTLMGYYMYSTSGNDSAQIMINLTNNTSMVGGGFAKLKAVGVYTFFKVPIAAFSTPDTIRVDVLSSVFSANATVGSALLLDNLSLKSQPLGLFNLSNSTDIKTFPNPAKDELTIQLSNSMNGAAHVYVYDITGRIVKENETSIQQNLIQLDVQELNPGIYFYKVSTENGSFQSRFVKE